MFQRDIDECTFIISISLSLVRVVQPTTNPSSSYALVPPHADDLANEYTRSRITRVSLSFSLGRSYTIHDDMLRTCPYLRACITRVFRQGVTHHHHHHHQHYQYHHYYVPPFPPCSSRWRGIAHCTIAPSPSTMCEANGLFSPLRMDIIVPARSLARSLAAFGFARSDSRKEEWRRRRRWLWLCLCFCLPAVIRSA